jgi:ribosomal protein S27AE
MTTPPSPYPFDWYSDEACYQKTHRMDFECPRCGWHDFYVCGEEYECSRCHYTNILDSWIDEEE